ncbi:MAG: FkbM family methyltransferase [Candidatus Woesearchaeota archaeon]
MIISFEKMMEIAKENLVQQEDKRNINLSGINNPNETKIKYHFLKYFPISFLIKIGIFYLNVGKGKKSINFFEDFVVSVVEKKYAFSFIEYLYKNNVYFDTSKYYFERKDVEEISKFLNAIICFLINDFIKKNFYEKIVSFSAIRKVSSLYKEMRIDKNHLLINGIKYYYPYYFLPESFYFHHGLKELPKKVIKRLEGGTFIDCGVCKGDSILVFQQYKPKKIIGFEPDEKNYRDAKVVIYKNKINKVILIKRGVGETEKEVLFNSESDGVSSISDQGNQKIEITTIDSLNEKIDLIKMDIEGYEYNAILGAEKTIKKYKPVLSISLYHTPRDFFEIPKLLKQWVPEYKMRFLNLNPLSPFFERVLFAYIE